MGQTQLMLENALAEAGKSKTIMVFGHDQYYARDLMRRLHEMATQNGVQPELTGSRVRMTIRDTLYEFRSAKSAMSHDFCGMRFKAFIDHYAYQFMSAEVFDIIMSRDEKEGDRDVTSRHQAPTGMG